MEKITETDIYKIIKRLVEFPFPQICVHYVAINLLSLLESKNVNIDNNLAKVLTQADDFTALELLDEIITKGNNMINISNQNGICVTTSKDKIVVNGEEIEIPKGMKTNSQSIINGRIFICGFEYFPKLKKFKRTFRAMWEYIFSIF